MITPNSSAITSRIFFGLDRRELFGIVARIPHIDDSERDVRRAIGNTLNNLLRYPHGRGAAWSSWISVSSAAVEQVESRWRALQPPIVYESFKVFGPTCFGGRYYRVVEYRLRGGGRGWGSEVWGSGSWLCPRDGPGCNEIIAAVPASPEVREYRAIGVFHDQEVGHPSDVVSVTVSA